MRTQDGWDWPNGVGDERWPAEPVKQQPEELKNLRPGRVIHVGARHGTWTTDTTILPVPHWPK